MIGKNKEEKEWQKIQRSDRIMASISTGTVHRKQDRICRENYDLCESRIYLTEML
jgi:hypothetical protein